MADFKTIKLTQPTANGPYVQQTVDAGSTSDSASVTHVNVTGNILVVTCNNTFAAGNKVSFIGLTNATFLNNQSVIVTAATTSSFTADFTNANYDSVEVSGYAGIGGMLVVTGAGGRLDSSVGGGVNSDWNAVSGVAAILNKPTSLPPSGSAGGDLFGSYPNPKVGGLAGTPYFAIPAPELGWVVGFDGVNWTPVPPSAGINQIIYISNTASDIGGYDAWNTTPIGAQFTFPTSVPGTETETLIKAFATISGYPDLTVIPSGEWEADSFIQVSDAGSTTLFYIDVYKRSSGGAETLLFSFPVQTISGNGTGIQSSSVSSIQEQISLLVTDRLVVKYSSSSGEALTVTLYGGGNDYYSHVHTPIGVVVAAYDPAGSAAAVQANLDDEISRAEGAEDLLTTGAASSIDSDFVQFSGTTGKIIKDGGISLDTDGTLTANSDSRVPSQKAVRTYVGSSVPITAIQNNGVTITPSSGAVSLMAGSNMTLTTSGNTLTFASTGGGGGSGGGTIWNGATTPLSVITTPSVVQVAPATVGNYPTTTFPGSVTAGHVLIVAIMGYLNTIPTVMDTLGTTYTRAALGGGSSPAELFYGVAPSSGSNTINASGAEWNAITAIEVVNLTTTVDASAVATIGAATVSLTTTTANDFVVSSIQLLHGGTATALGGDTLIGGGVLDGTVGVCLEYGLRPTAGATTQSWTVGNPADSTMTTVAFKAVVTPASGVGSTGDLYLDTGNNVIYGPKAAIGGWVSASGLTTVLQNNGTAITPSAGAVSLVPGSGITLTTSGNAVTIASALSTIQNSGVAVTPVAGVVNLAAGSNMTLTTSGDTITFASSGGGGTNHYPFSLNAGVPSLASLTQINISGTASVVENVGAALTIVDTNPPPDASNIVRCLAQSVPGSTPYRVAFYVLPTMLSEQWSGYGVGWRDSSTGKMEFVSLLSPGPQYQTWSSSTTRAATGSVSPGIALPFGVPVWLGLHDDGAGNAIWEMSQDGAFWTPLLTIVKASGYIATYSQVILCLFCDDATYSPRRPIALSVVCWDVNGLSRSVGYVG